MAIISVYGILHPVEQWIRGYQLWHFQLGLQQALCFVLALLPVLIDAFYDNLDKGGSALYSALAVRSRLVLAQVYEPCPLYAAHLQACISPLPPPPPYALTQVAVLLEPSTGDALRKFFIRMLACGISGGIGILLLFGGNICCCCCPPPLTWPLVPVLKTKTTYPKTKHDPPPARRTPPKSPTHTCPWLPVPAAVGPHNSDYTFASYRTRIGVWVVVGMALCGFVYQANRQRYWRSQDYWITALLTLPIVVVPAVRRVSVGRVGGGCGTRARGVVTGWSGEGRGRVSDF